MVFTCFLILCATNVVHGQSPHGKTSRGNVLMVNSYHKGLPWQDGFDEGLRKGLSQTKKNFQIYYEYLDAARFAIDQDSSLAPYLHNKYKDKNIDLIVTESGPAYNFISKNSEFFKGAQHLYIHPDQLSAEDIKDDTTGSFSLLVANRFKESIEEMLRIYSPDTVYVITDTSTEARKKRFEDFKNAITEFNNKVTFKYLVNLPIDKLLDQVSKLPPGSAIYYLLVFQDGTGKKFIPFNVARLLAQRTNVPIFSQWKSLMGSGITGGYLLSGERVGKLVSQAIIKGKTSHLKSQASFGYYYDSRQLQRHGISTSKLPPNSQLLYKSWYQKNRTWVQTGIVLIFIITLLILAYFKTHQQRLRTQKELEQSEEQYRLLFEKSTNMMCLVVNKRFVMVNAAAYRTLGFESPEEMMAVNIIDISAETQADGSPSADLIEENLAAAFRHGHKQFEWIFKKRNGDEFPAEVSLTRIPFKGEDALFAISQDISERKEAEKAIINAHLQAEAATKAKSAFLANMSHEIRTPMNAIIGMTHLALQTNLTDKQENYIKKANLSATNLLNIINDILDFSKIEADKMELEKSNFQLKDVIHNMINLIKLKAVEKNIQLRVKIDTDVPTRLIGDALRISQVLINLANNSVKFSLVGGSVSVHVVKGEETDQKVELIFSVIDTGIGISPEQQKNLFQPFSQADSSTTRKFGGTGLGLIISQKIVQKMGGALWLESKEGCGSTFSFNVYLEKQPTDAPQSSATQNRNRGEVNKAIANLRGTRVLLVEDNEINQELASELLVSQSIIVETAMNGKEALELLAKENFDLVLMDCQMPIMDGYEATRKIREQDKFKDLPVIALSANVMKNDVEMSFAVGMDDHIGKPLDPDQLFLTMAKYHSRKNRDTQNK